MATQKTSRRLSGLGLLLALSGCMDGGHLEAVETIESVCTAAARKALVVDVFDPDEAIDSVTAMHDSEQQCYLERAPNDDAGTGDASEPGAARYACWEQGQGTYLVRVTSGERTWTQSIDVLADECHVTEVQRLTFELR